MFSSIPPPTLTEKNAPTQAGRVFIITGGYAGIGYELSKILYHLNGRVYVAGRSETKAQAAIKSIQASTPAAAQALVGGSGSLHFLRLDLADLTTIKASAQAFLAAESRLDVIWHNAGVMVPPDGSVTAQGFDLQLGTNALGPWLFQSFLTPLCLETAALSDVQKNATRVVFVTSNAHAGGPAPDGVNWIDLDMKDRTGIKANILKYSQSKAMNVMHAHELTRRHHAQGLVAVSVHPGALSTNLQRDLPWFLNWFFRWFRHHPHEGAITELYAGLSGDVGATMLEDGGVNGGYVGPWGRFVPGKDHIFEGLANRGTGERLWSVSEDLLKEYM